MRLDLKKRIGNKRKICRYCFSTENLTIDHKKPLSKGGTNEKGNLQYLCRQCNVYKDNMGNRKFRNLIVNIAALLRRKAQNNPDAYARQMKKLNKGEIEIL